MFVGLHDEPYWACIYDPLTPLSEDGAELWLEVWSGLGFQCWHPEQLPQAIVAVVPVFTDNDAPGRRGKPSDTHRHGRLRHQRHTARAAPTTAWATRGQARPGRLVCGASQDGEAYAVVLYTDGEQIEGAPTGGQLLGSLRSKFSLPPGPASPHVLDISPGSCPRA
jgi:hypothetical protein